MARLEISFRAHSPVFVSNPTIQVKLPKTPKPPADGYDSSCPDDRGVRFYDSTFSNLGLSRRFAGLTLGEAMAEFKGTGRPAILCLTFALSATLCLIVVRLPETGRIGNKRLRRHLWPTYGCND